MEERAKEEDREWRRKAREKGLALLQDILTHPDKVVRDEKSIIYVKELEKGRYIGVVIGTETLHYIYTVQPMGEKSLKERYQELY